MFFFFLFHKLFLLLAKLEKQSLPPSPGVCQDFHLYCVFLFNTNEVVFEHKANKQKHCSVGRREGKVKFILPLELEVPHSAHPGGESGSVAQHFSTSLSGIGLWSIPGTKNQNKKHAFFQKVQWPHIGFGCLSVWTHECVCICFQCWAWHCGLAAALPLSYPQPIHFEVKVSLQNSSFVCPLFGFCLCCYPVFSREFFTFVTTK